MVPAGQPPARQRSLKSLSPAWTGPSRSTESDCGFRSQPSGLEPQPGTGDARIRGASGKAGFGGLIFLNDNNVVARRAVELSLIHWPSCPEALRTKYVIHWPHSTTLHNCWKSHPPLACEMRLINIIQNHAKRMNGIIENILQLSGGSSPGRNSCRCIFLDEFVTTQVNRQMGLETEDAFCCTTRAS